MSPTDCGASCVIKKPRTRGGYSPARGLQNTITQWVVAPVEKKYQERVAYGPLGRVRKATDWYK